MLTSHRMRAFPVIYALDVEAVAGFWELLGFERHVELPPDGPVGYVGLRRAEGPEVAVTNAQWATGRYGWELGDGPRFEMYVYVDELDETVSRLRGAGVAIVREPEEMPWGERIATAMDPQGNPVALCQQK